MKYGLVGSATVRPLEGEPTPPEAPEAMLRGALRFLLDDVEADRVLYLGVDEVIDRVVAAWAEELVPGGGDEAAFLDQVASRAADASPEELDALLAADRLRERLGSRVHTLPDRETCVVEMLEGRILVAVYDKARLGEEDIANAQILVYGKASKPLLKRFGPRTFYTPGPVGTGELGVLEALASGEVRLSTYTASGELLGRESLQGKAGAKMVVT